MFPIQKHTVIRMIIFDLFKITGSLLHLSLPWKGTTWGVCLCVSVCGDNIKHKHILHPGHSRCLMTLLILTNIKLLSTTYTFRIDLKGQNLKG